ncbi:unnamed protein product, partial [Staurois parvus]
KTHISDGLRNRDTAPLSVSRWVRPHADTSTFPWTRCVHRMTCHPCHLATSPGSLNSSASSPVIGRLNCSSGEAHRRPITGEEEGAEQQHEDQRRSSKGAAREGRQLTARYAGCRWEREGASPGWSRSQ